MGDTALLKRTADALAENLDAISSALKSQKPEGEDKYFKGELYARLSDALKGNDSVCCGSSFLFDREKIFSPQAHRLMVETQSLLNVLCSELNLPFVYISSETSCGDNPVSLMSEPFAVTLHKAYAVADAARKIVQLSETA